MQNVLKQSRQTSWLLRLDVAYTRPQSARNRLGPSTSNWTAGRRRHLTTHVNAAKLQFGQPLHETHPHLLKPGELTPGITALEYATRRAQLVSKLPTGAIAVLASATLKYRSDPVVFYPYRQQSDFWYLTGFAEPEAVAVIRKTGQKGNGDHEFALLCREKDEQVEEWEGPRSGLVAAEDVFNADKTGNIDQIHRLLPDLLADASAIYTDILSPPSKPSLLSRFFRSPKRTTSSSSSSPSEETTFTTLLASRNVHPLRPLLNELRVIKSTAEISLMRHIGQASARALTNTMRHPADTEKSLADFLDYETKRLGCSEAAYVPVVAGGARGQCIHYVANDQRLRREELVLVDAGGELGGYITDITRCWPVGGKFSAPQRELYEMVLRVQRLCVSLCRRDARVSLDGLHELATAELAKGLRELGFELGSGGRAGGGKDPAMDVLFPHHVGHYIGLDVHDASGWSRSAVLRPGMCVAVEPAVYVPDEERWPARFRRLAVRIEDSVCVQEESPLVLTTEAIKEVVDIEDWMR